MLNIKVACTGVKARCINGEGVTLIEMSEEATIGDLAAELMLPQDLLLVYIVNGELGKMDYKLKNEDVVQIFSPMAGG